MSNFGQEDTVDINIFKKLFGRKSKIDVVETNNEDAINKVSKNSDIYDMNNFKRGIALIFNNSEFTNMNISLGKGTIEDVNALNDTLSWLHFDVCVCQDYTYGEIFNKLNEVSQEDHSEYDCFTVVVLSHGVQGKIYAKDFGYPPDTLWSPFSGDKCPSLAGKPKMFFIHASLGSKVDTGVLSRSFRDSSADTYTVPVMSDLLVVYSTYPGFVTWRNKDGGSWFVEYLCQELKSKAREKDLLYILTAVNRRVALEFESNTPDDPTMDSKKQTGSMVSTFTRLLYFFPNEQLDLSATGNF